MKRCPTCQRTYADSAAFCSVDASPLIASEDHANETGRVVDRKYRIERLLGEGGMGTVYEATHLEIGRRVALKLMNPALVRDPAALERFRREARAAGRLEHPNAVTIHDFGVDATGDAYLVMELLDGPSLRDVLQQRGALPPGEVCDILEPVADAIDAAHAEGIIHRDLKPDNIMLARRGAQSVVKVLDFGIAKLAAPDAGVGTLTGTGVIGTPYYMSPEQGEGQRLDARSDVYSLGVVAFELLTGRVPFRGDTPISTLVKHVNTPPPRPSSVLPTLGGSVDGPILWALEKDPARRPQTARAFVDALRSVCRGVPSPETIALDRTAAVSPATAPVAVATMPSQGVTDRQSTPTTIPATTAPAPPSVTHAGSPAAVLAFVGIAVLLLVVTIGGFTLYAMREQLGLVDATPPSPPAPSTPTTPSGPILPPPATGPTPAETSPSGPPPKESHAKVAITPIASSSRAAQGTNVYTPDRALDGRPETAWCEGGQAAGIGETLTLRFATPTRVARLRVLPGYFKSPDRWSQNNRLASVRIILSDGRTISAKFEDVMVEQTVAIGGGPVDSVSLVIEKVWSGGDGLDTLVSEIAVEVE